MNDEHTILNHYNLTSSFPNTWPAEKNDSDASEDEHSADRKNGIRRSKSRYSALERAGSDRRSLVPGAQKLKDGQENLVQKDEPDPLGTSSSVVRVLRQKGLPVEEDTRLRNRFMLSSTTFSPSLYLSQVQSNASTQELLQGLDVLSRSIDQKSASLKVLVESNFERFVRAKTTIDNVYAEMRNQGADPEGTQSPTHSRVTSRSSNNTHFRNVSGTGMKRPTAAAGGDKKKNALIKDSEYGVQGIKTPLIEAATKAEEVWGPALGGREKEGSLQAIVESVERNEGVFRVGKMLNEAIKRRDFEKLVEEYTKAKRYMEDAKHLAENAERTRSVLTDLQVHQIVITGRMWSEAEDKVEKFKRDTWRHLTNSHLNQASINDVVRGSSDDHMALISILLELGTDDNPIWVWLLSRYDYLKSKINATFERSRVEIEVLRRRLANADAPDPRIVAGFLRSSTAKDGDDYTKDLDTVPVLELWDLIHNSMDILLAVPGGILGELLEFWDKAQVFIDGKVQKTLPIGIDGRSRKHHRLSADGVKDLQNGAAELVEMLQDYVCSFFADPPIEDLSVLFSPLSPMPNTPKTPQTASLSPYAHQDSRFQFDDLNPPPASPKRGEDFEGYAFWPPHANSLSGTHYLDKLLTLTGQAASEMLAMRPVASGTQLPEKLRAMVNNARERSVRAACSAWNRDAELCKNLEDWSRTSDQSDLTNMPTRFGAFENQVLAGMQKVLYIPEVANAKIASVGVVSPPPSKLVQMVRSQFVTSLYKALSGMVENAESSTTHRDASEATRGGEIDVPMSTGDAGVVNNQVSGKGLPTYAVSPDRYQNIRKLLTLSNLKVLQSDIVPQLISQFEINFSTPLTDESKTVRDVLTQISDRLFHSYTKPIATRLAEIVFAGITSADWIPPTGTRPSDVRPYVYEALLLLVYVHTEISTTAAPLTNTVLSHLLEQMSFSFLAAFEKRSRFPLAALCQATLDVEFVAQTMSQYTTKKASETQSRLYLALDERTTQDASKQLQGELPEMRNILKRLREGTRSEFLCFKKERGRGSVRESSRT